MAGAFTTDIPGTECLGDSRPRINTNFTNLDTAVQALSGFTTDFGVTDTTTIDHTWNATTKKLSTSVKSASISATQLANSVQQSLVPTGCVMSFALSAAPTGWYPCDGTTVSRTGSGANLFAAIGTIYGAGNNTTTFNVPNLRGMFIRGWTPSITLTSRDPLSASRTLGSVQEDEFKSHNHANGFSPQAVPASGGTATGWTGQGPTPGTTGSIGGLETRPVNIALLYCIKL